MACTREARLPDFDLDFSTARKVTTVEPFGIEGFEIGEKWSLKRDSVSKCHVIVILSY